MTSELNIKSIENKAGWTKLLAQCQEADLQQTWEYGQGVSTCVGWEPVRQIISKDGSPLALAQTLIKKIPAIGLIARIQHGPMFIQNNFSMDSAEDTLKSLQKYWVEQKGAILHLTPCIFAKKSPDGWAKQVGFSPSDEPLWQSIRIDLSQSQKILLKNMKRRWRSPLQKSEKSGLTVQVCDSQADLEFFLEKYQEAAVQKGFSWPSPDLVRAIWKTDKSLIRLVFAAKANRRLGAMVLQQYADTQFCLAAWNSPEAGKFHAHNFLIWQSICYAQTSGAKWIDLGGIDPENLPGITKFKRGLGGEEYQLIGNFESRPSIFQKNKDTENYRKGLGHVLLGLDLPNRPGADDLQEKVMAFIAQFVQQIHGSDLELDANMSLIESGIIDSLSLVTIVQSLQESFGVEIGVQDITLENFDSIETITAFIKSRKK